MHLEAPVERVDAVTQPAQAAAARGSAPPMPSSRISTRTRPRSSLSRTSAPLAPAYLATLVSASAVMK